MISKLPRSQDAVLGFATSGDITKEDYTNTLVPDVQQAVDTYGTICVLLDMSDFHWEKAEAWSDDLHFGKTYHQAIVRMAIVGDHTWEKALAKAAAPWYAQEAQYFTDINEAWGWLEAWSPS